jgi:hypothetical protein
MVDGTLIPLYAQPGYFGNTWYDHKNNYSLNLQVCVVLYGLEIILIISSSIGCVTRDVLDRRAD